MKFEVLKTEIRGSFHGLWIGFFFHELPQSTGTDIPHKCFDVYAGISLLHVYFRLLIVWKGIGRGE